MALTATHTFEEGTNGSAVPNAANGVVSVSNATYGTADAIHGSLGVRLSASGGAVGYAAPAAAFQCSFYGKVVTFSSGNSTILSGRTTSSHQARLRVNATGHFEIANASNTVVATSTATVAAGDAFRADVRFDNSAGTSTTVTVRLYLRSNIEGSTPDETLGPQTFTTTGLNRVYTGTTTTPTWVHSVDTIRLYDDVTTWPVAFGTIDGSLTAVAATATAAAVAPAASGGGSSGSVTGVAATATAAAIAPTASGTVPGSVTYVHSGAARSDRVMITAKTSGTTSVRLGYSTSSVMASPSFLSAQTPDANGEFHWDLTGLSADTKYYYRLYDTPTGGSEVAIGSITSTRTRPSSATSGNSIKIALGSCCLTATTQDDSAFANAVAWDPHYVLHLGDAYYNGVSTNTLASQHRTKWEAQIAAVPEWKAMLAAVAVDYINSDHELNPDDADSNNTNASSFNSFYKATVPARLVDTGSPPAGKYRSWVDYVNGIGIRFILLDIRNTDRSPGANTDNSSKTMLGATQLAWLKNELIDSDAVPTALKVIISDVPWNGTASLANGVDKWWAYSTERQDIADYITNNHVNVDFLHGDSHRIAVDNTHNAWGGFPVICGSPWSQDGGGNELSGMMDAEFHNSGTPTSAYMRITYDSPASGQIRRVASGWDAMSDTQKISQTNIWSTVAAVRATATAAAIAPAVQGVQAGTVAAVVATAVGAAIAPSVSGTQNPTVAAVVATATASAQAPAVSGVQSPTVTGVAATATAAASPPSLSGAAAVLAIAATAVVAMVSPSVTGTQNPTIAPPVAAATAQLNAPTISAGGSSTVSPPAAVAMAAATAPVVTGVQSPTTVAVAAAGQAAAAAPAVTGTQSATVAAVLASATAVARPPAVGGTQNPTLAAPTATVTADAQAPVVAVSTSSWGGGVGPTATLQALVPGVSVAHEVLAPVATTTAAARAPVVHVIPAGGEGEPVANPTLRLDVPLSALSLVEHLGILELDETTATLTLDQEL